MRANPNCPACDVKECAANDSQHCVILIKKEFGARKCPFFKTKAQVAEEREYCQKRMAELRKGMKVC